MANITEQDVESMNDEDYSRFEELQTQVYVGKYDIAAMIPVPRKKQRIDNWDQIEEQFVQMW